MYFVHPMSSRRRFIKNVTALSLGTQIIPIVSCGLEPNASWSAIADQFFKDKQGRLNFNTGSVGMMPKPVYENYIQLTKSLASYAAYEVKDQSEDYSLAALESLAATVGATKEDITLVRNTSEGINFILNDYPFQPEDEVLISSMAYPYPHYTLDKLSALKGIKKINIDLNPASDSDEQIVHKFISGITSKTKMILVTHFTHREGQIMPVKAICEEAQKRGVEVLVDGAHAVGQFGVDIQDLNCNYYVSSLHKWMYAPLGTGLLYVKDQNIPKLSPPLSYPGKLQNDLSKFNYTGTVPFQNELTLQSVLDFNEAIEWSRKTQRIKELQSQLIEGLKGIPSITIMTDPKRSCGVVGFGFDHIHPAKVAPAYLQSYGIHCKKTKYKDIPMLRATVNLHLLEKDIDAFIEATTSIAQS